MPQNLLRVVFTISMFLFVLFLIDAYAWKGISSATEQLSAEKRKYLKVGYWSLSVLVYLGFLVIFGSLFLLGKRPTGDASTPFLFIGILFLFIFPKLVIVLFHAVEDLIWAGRWLFSRISSSNSNETGAVIGRAHFLSQMGLFLSAIPFGAILYGITKGRSEFEVERVEITNKRIPKAFDGYKIVQISDMHLGSLAPDNVLVSKGVEMINALEPDLILFTGDMVNDLAIETDKWLGILSELKATTGKYSVLGNHDYADYFYGHDDSQAKRENLNALMDNQKQIGFQLMMDENTRIEKNGEHIRLLGVQNYGGRGFARYGDLSKAYQGCQENEFKLLMSHDPSHWDLQVKDTDIDLMLAGHTHGAQFGFKYKGKRYSPASMIYKQWAGLYGESGKQLYVNRGFGYLAFPGRVGMPPEITLLTLKSV